MTLRDRYAFARSIQVLGMTIPPLAIAAEVFGQVGLGQSLLIAAVGVGIFSIGQRLQPRL